GSRLKLNDVPGRSRLICQPSSRTGENPPYGMIGGIEETSASFEARSAPRPKSSAQSASKEAKGAALIMPARNTEAMNLQLAEIAEMVPLGAHAILVIDRAGGHLLGR